MSPTTITSRAPLRQYHLWTKRASRAPSQTLGPTVTPSSGFAHLNSGQS